MKFIANNNKTLVLNITNSITFENLCEREEVLNFFDTDFYEIAGNVTHINTVDVTELSGLDSVLITPNDEVTVDLEAVGNATEETSTEVPTPGMVTISKCGLISKEMPIICGMTKVIDLMTLSTANYFATTVDNLVAMEVYINDVRANTAATLNDGDEIVISERKAGQKGAGAYRVVTIKDAGSEPVQLLVWKSDMSAADAVEAFVNAGYNKVIVAIEIGNSCITIGSDIWNMIKDTSIESIKEVSLLTATALQERLNNVEEELEDVFNDDDDDDFEDDFESPCDDCCGCPQQSATATANDAQEASGDVLTGPPTGTLSSVTVFYASGCASQEISIVSGVTKLEDVVFSQRMLNLQGMTAEMARGMVYTINEVREHDLSTTLEAGDIIHISPRCAGQKG